MKKAKKKNKYNNLPGGKAQGKTIKDFSPAERKQIEMGTKFEMEHTNSKKLAREIAMDHVTEFGTYYTELKKMENKLKRQKKIMAQSITTKKSATISNNTSGRLSKKKLSKIHKMNKRIRPYPSEIISNINTIGISIPANSPQFGYEKRTKKIKKRK